MSRQPEPPASIAYPPFFERIFVAMVNSHLRGDVVAKSTQIGFDALVAEGEFRVRMRPPAGTVGDWPLNELTEELCLVVPLPVVEPRDTEQGEQHMTTDPDTQTEACPWCDYGIAGAPCTCSLEDPEAAEPRDTEQQA